MVNAIQVLQADLRSLFEDRTGDFKVVVETSQGSDTIVVWEALIRKRSVVFEAMLSHDLKESQEKQLTLKGFNLTEVELFFEFLYTGAATLSSTVLPGVSELADKYQVPSLQQMCQTWMEQNVAVDTVGEIYKSCLRFSSERCQSQDCLLFIDANAQETMHYLHILPDAEIEHILSRDSLCILDAELADTLVTWVEQGHKEASDVAPLLQKYVRMDAIPSESRAALLPRLKKVSLDEWGIAVQRVQREE